jgi:hypothetical protein
VTVILVLSQTVNGYINIWRLWLAVLVAQKLLTPIFISLLAIESVSLIVLWNKRIIPWNKDCLWRIEEISHRTDSTKLLIAFDLPIGSVAAVVVCPLPWANSVHSYR